jgi:hypothetical protein
MIDTLKQKQNMLGEARTYNEEEDIRPIVREGI